MKKRVIKLTETELRKLIMDVVLEQAAPQTTYNPIKTADQLGPVPASASNLSCVKPQQFTQKDSSGKSYLVIDNMTNAASKVGNRTVLYNDGTGSIISNGGTVGGKWSCGSSGIEFRPTNDPKAVTYVQIPKTPATPVKPTFKPNDNFPLHFLDMGAKIKLIQQKLSVKPTGNFYVTTEAKIKSMFKNYNRASGIDQQMYNQIMGLGQATNKPNEQGSYQNPEGVGGESGYLNQNQV